MSQVSLQRGTLLRYAADWRPLTFIWGAFALHVVVFWYGSPMVAMLSSLPFLAMSTLVAALNHHHQHVNVFRSPVLNRINDIVLALQTGVGPYTWVLHHNLGHHKNYLRQPPCETPDESHWTRKDGSAMGRLEYTLHLFLHHQVDVYRVGRQHPELFRNYLLMKIPLYSLMSLGIYLNAFNFLFVFFLPSLFALVHTCWATYEHHAGHRTDDHYDASVNRESAIFNFLTCNLGLHTAHHMEPDLHWSLLPELHRRIRPQIPEHLLLKTFW